MATWRQMSARDAPAVRRVADEIHPGLPEGDHVFAERATLFPEGCLVLAEGDDLRGYAISHPIRRGQPPALDSLLGEVPADADQYFIHDVAILPRLRGRGLAGDCVRSLLEVARRYPTTGLISVYGTASFWARFGFAAEPLEEGLSEKLRGYGEDAVYLTRDNTLPW
ncbi:hypothetical protein VUR80DRAFT_2569 [Thermomyces stellatus]